MEAGVKPAPAGEDEEKAKPVESDGAAADDNEKPVSDDAEPAAKVLMICTRRVMPRQTLHRHWQ